MLRRRDLPQPLHAVVGPAFRAACGADLGAHPGVLPLRRAGLAVAAAMDRAASAGELPYHNRQHVAEVAMAMGWLCGAARRMGQVSAGDAAMGVAAMLGHDLGHDGDTTLDGRLEAGAAASVCAIARAAGVPLRDRAGLAEIIRATRPDLVRDNARRAAGPLPPGRGGAGMAMLRLLANEADVFASFLPGLGLRLAIALATERRAVGDTAADRVASHAGRLAFLLGFRRFSPAARRLGLAKARDLQVAAYARVARRLGAGTRATEGAQNLDRLPRPDADRLLGLAWNDL